MKDGLTIVKELKDKIHEQYMEIQELNKARKTDIEYNKYLQKEIEQLNNIINELEKWLEEQHQFIIEIPAYTKEIAVEHKTMEICYENVLDKLQELLGSDKE